MAGQNEHRYLTSGEMVQLLIQNLRECDPDLARFETFLDQFSAENDEFLTNLNDIFVCAVHRQCVELAEILLNRYLTSKCFCVPWCAVNGLVYVCARAHARVSDPDSHDVLTQLYEAVQYSCLLVEYFC